MQIANPIYDVVFRYMMEDNKVAKLILSALTGEEIMELDFRPTEKPLQFEGIPTVLRMDFSAIIKTSEGVQKQVLIELQKAKYYLEIMRFRRYLGEQYANPSNKIEHPMPSGKNRIEGRRILPVFILGEKITEQPIPVLRVGREYVDAATNEVCGFKHEFIEALTHDGIFVQIPHLKGRRRNDLEQLLHVFDQSNVEATQRYFLFVDEDVFPEKYRPVIRRLKQAIASKKVIDQMKGEDEILEMFRHTEKEKETMQRIAEKATERADEATKYAGEAEKRADEAKKHADEAKKHADEAKKHADEEKRRADDEEKRADLILKISIQNLHQAGKSIEEMALLFGKTLEDIKAYLS